MPRQLRDLFAYICVFGPPANPRELWNEFKLHVIEDYCMRVHNKEGECTRCESFAMKDIQDILIVHGLSYENYDLPAPALNMPDLEDLYDIDREQENALALIDTLNNEQKQAFEAVKNALQDENLRAKCFFLDGPGGSGKTYMYGTLIHYVRGLGKRVLAAATTGIAANLLNKGKTMHSLYGLPIPLNETSVSRIKMNSKAAETFRKADLFIIDECTMASNHAINTIDRFLQELCQNNIPFGGKVILFGGDFRQCLPIIPHALRPAIVQGSMKYSKPWVAGKFEHITLAQNMRSIDQDYSNWLLKLGNGSLNDEIILPTELKDLDLVEIPSEFICEDIVSSIFGDQISYDMVKAMAKRAILCLINDDLDAVNENVMNIS